MHLSEFFKERKNCDSVIRYCIVTPKKGLCYAISLLINSWIPVGPLFSLGEIGTNLSTFLSAVIKRNSAFFTSYVLALCAKPLMLLTAIIEEFLLDLLLVVLLIE